MDPKFNKIHKSVQLHQKMNKLMTIKLKDSCVAFKSTEKENDQNAVSRL